MPLNIGMGREGNNESGKAAHDKASGCGKQCTSLYCFLNKRPHKEFPKRQRFNIP